MGSLRITPEDLKTALPDTSSNFSLDGLELPVEILRDRYGIPHIRADTPQDAFFAQGFATAQDRLWHMDYDRHCAYGRWAEFVGKIGFDQDRSMRRLRLQASARADYQVIDPGARQMLEAYAAGVNAFIGTTRSLPIEYRLVEAEPEPWQPWDCLAVFKVRHILMGTFEAKIWRAKLVNQLGPEKAARLLPGYEEGQPLIVPPGATYSGPGHNGLGELEKGADCISRLRDTDAGSNSWVLGGSRTASGKPIIAGDPHRALDTPNVYYQNHLSCPEFDVVGLSFPGMPGFPHFGHSARVAWCVTHTMADYQDLYIERFKEGDASFYLFRGEWRRAEVHHETIKVRNGHPEELDVTVTHHGPIIAGDPAEGHALAFRYTATAEPIQAANSILTMLRAESVDEMDEAMRWWVDPVNNFLFADVHGNIEYLTRGRLPVRTLANAWLPVPGWTGEHEWRGVVPFEEMPRVRNPEADYIITANNRVVEEDYPYYIALDYDPGFRAQRIKGRLSDMKNARAQNMPSIHADDTSILAQQFVRLISEIDVKDREAKMSKEQLLRWDGRMDKNKAEPTIYSAFRDVLMERIAAYVLGPLSEEILRGEDSGGAAWVRRFGAQLPKIIRQRDLSLLPPGEDWDSLMASALSEATARLRSQLGNDMDSWKWGRVHVTQPRHTLSRSFPQQAELLDPPGVSVSGDGHTPLATNYVPVEPYTVVSASVARYVFDLGDWSNSGWVVPLGASGHPGSRHYADQVPLWRDLQLLPMLFDRRSIDAEAESRQVLSPRE